MNHFFKLLILCFVVLFAEKNLAAGTLLNVDFGQTQTPNNVQAGFSAFGVTNLSVAGPITATFGQYTVRVTSGVTVDGSGNLNSTTKINARNRGIPSADTGTFTYSALYQDFVCVDGSSNSPLAVQVGGLSPNTPYNLTIYAYDNSSDKILGITDLTGGGSASLGSISWTAASTFNSTTANEVYSLTSQVTSDGSGRVTLQLKYLTAGGGGAISGLTLSSAPQLGVYKGGRGQVIESSSVDSGNFVGTQWFESYLGVPIPSSITGGGYSGWAFYDTADNFSVWRNTRYTPNIMIFMMPETKTGSAWTYTLAQGAAGAYTSHFTNLATNMVNEGMGNATIRLGHEMNGNWYPWFVGDATSAANYKAYWINIVNAMRAVPGAHFKFNFCVANGFGSNGYNASNAYPGDAYVDSIGVDVYNTTYVANGDNPATRWNDLNNSNNGITFWNNFAVTHHKPLSFPEWGTTGPATHAAAFKGGDDPFFISNMYNWITSANVEFHNYWDYQGDSTGMGYWQLSPLPSQGNAFQYPLSSTLFKELFGAPSWWEKDLGTVGIPGNSSENPSTGIVSVQGSGTGIGGTAESCHFSYTAKMGDCVTSAQITGIQNTSTNAVAGVMIREDLTAGSKCLFFGITQSGAVRASIRSTTGGGTANFYSTTGQALPYWVKIGRVGNVFTAYTSTDGVTWTSVGSQTLIMNPNVYMGEAVAGITNTALNTCTFASPDQGIEIVQDTEDGTAGGITLTGSWSTISGASGTHDSNYIRISPSSGGTVRFTPTIPVAGTYTVYLWTNNHGASSSPNVPITVQHAGTSTPVTFNEAYWGGAWEPLGIYNFNAGTSDYVEIGTTGATGLYVVADAIRFVKNP